MAVAKQDYPVLNAELTVAIVGRPNVGKSTLFNRLTGQRRAITSGIEGTTRDRIYGMVTWNGHTFSLIDTGGYIPRSEDQINTTVRRQVDVAMEQADWIIFVVDASTGITTIEQELANKLREQTDRVLVVVNKVDSDNQEMAAHEFWNLGLGEPVPISAESGRKTGDMLDELVRRFPEDTAPGIEDPDRIPLAIVGMPNVGKSSFANAILNQEVSIVTDIPGTTRDTVHSDFAYYGQKYRLIDTAGLRKRSKIAEEVEYYSLIRTYQAINNSSVAIVIVDGNKGFSRRDAEILRYVLDKKKGLVIAINKWDLIEKETNTAKIFQDDIIYRFPELQFYPFAFISVLKRQRLYKPIQQAAEVFEERGKSIKTSALNDYLQPIIDSTPPPRVKGKFIRIKYITQVKSAPPVFAFFVNDPSLIPENYRKFLEHKIREKWGFQGVPLTLSFREK
ncbi:MAG: GTPase Der [Candidatus Marinimicrobia bacterium]|nr:GTPase Der [Candidatus Neomarinimicrobiota bacterium]